MVGGNYLCLFESPASYRKKGLVHRKRECVEIQRREGADQSFGVCFSAQELEIFSEKFGKCKIFKMIEKEFFT